MPNEFVIKNGFISQGNSIVNGSLTATTYYGDGSNLTGVPNFYVTGGTYSNGTLTLNRQNGSVTITGFTTGFTSSINITPFYVEPSSTGVTWNVSGNSTNYKLTLTANTTLNLNNVRNGDYGTIILIQDSGGNKTITLGTLNGSSTTHKVVNGGAGLVSLTTTANAIDILSFTYDGTNMYWNKGLNYT